ncbi:MAG: YvcK family protein, partial [Parcubacteria group bacterium]|nr:YvcK family protein [Parcubacteria group bacterium]
MKKIVVIGGGTGVFTVLIGLKNYPFHLSAIVTTADDGGSSGILREEFGILPPGDIRRAFIALANISPVIEDLFNYRFQAGSLKGHNFANLLI